MPLYDYDCAACGRRVEVVHGVYAPGPTHCPHCGGGPLRKAISAPAVHFKGSGWAKRDRRTTVPAGGSRETSDAPAAAEGGTKDGSPSSGNAKSEGSGDPGAADLPAVSSKVTKTGAASVPD